MYIPVNRSIINTGTGRTCDAVAEAPSVQDINSDGFV